MNDFSFGLTSIAVPSIAPMRRLSSIILLLSQVNMMLAVHRRSLLLFRIRHSVSILGLAT